MGASDQSDPPDAASSRSERSSSGRALVFTDIVGSTLLKQVLGDREGTERILRRHEEARLVLKEVGEGEEISTAGDGMFLSFDSPARALRFALILQRRIRGLWPGEPPARRLRDRMGIHFGEVEVRHFPDGSKDLFGLEVDRANRVMSLGGADQILLTQSAFDRARQAWSDALGRDLGELSWVSHGIHQLANLDHPQELFEVGEVGLAFLQAPAAAKKKNDSANITGWRPAGGEPVPGSDWRLERRLGGGPAEEVWRAVNRETSVRCILRFCFEANRLKRLRQRRELLEGLVRLAGEHPHLARVTACALEVPPYYVAYEFVPGRPLPDWLETAGETASQETKLELIAQLADALEGAHRAGIIHGDLKPGAVVVAEDGAGRPQVKLARLGLGQVSADETLAAIKMLWDSTPTGAVPVGPRFDGHVYLAPELLQGEDPSVKSDLYALGVLMYQLLVGDFMRPVTADWAAHIGDPLVREDLSRCLAAVPEQRLASVGELAVRIRTLVERRQRESDRERRAFLKGVLRTGVVAAVVVGILGWQTYRADQEARSRARTAEDLAVETQKANKNERTAHQRLVGLQVALGEATRSRGDVLGSALYQAEALRLVSEASRLRNSGNGDEYLHRMRVATQLQQAPALVQAWWFPEEVHVVVFRPRTDQVLIAHPRGKLELLEMGNGKSVQTFSHDSEVMSVVFLDDGRTLVTTGEDQFVRWWNIESGQEIGQFRLRDAGQHLALSPDGRFLAVVAGDLDRAAIHLFQGGSRTPFAAGIPVPHSIQEVAFSPASDELAAACGDGIARRWTLPELSPLPPLEHPEISDDPNRLVQIQYSPDGRKLLTASQDHSAGLWDRATGERQGWFWHLTWLTSASFSEDSSRILTTSFDGMAYVWSAVPNPATSSPVRPTPTGSRGFLHKLPHGHTVLNGEFSADQSRIVTACFDHGAWLWNGETGELIARLKHAGYVHLVRFHPDSRRVLTASRDGSVKLWDLGGMVGDPPVRIENGRGRPVVRTADGGRFLSTPSAGTLQLWDAEEWKPLGPAWQTPGTVRVLTLDPTGERVLLETRSGLRLRSARDGSPGVPEIISGPIGEVEAAFFLNDSAQLLVVCRGFESGFHWFSLDGSTNQPPREVELSGRAQVFLSGDGRTVMSSDARPTDGKMIVRFHDARSGEEVHQPIECGGSEVHVALNTPGEFALISPSDGSFSPMSAMLMNLSSGDRWELPHDDGVLIGRISPNNNLVATASEDGTARIWKCPSGRLLRVLSHQHQVRSLTFRADGLLLASGSRDNTARVWVAATGEALTPPFLHLHVVGDLWFTPDGQHLVTASPTRTSAEAVRWSLMPRELPPDDLKKFTELLNCQIVETPGAAIPLPAEDVKRRWGELLAQHPELFQVTANQIATWHMTEAQKCSELQRWSAAVEHWNQVELRRALTPEELEERRQAQEQTSAALSSH
ncbi:MAG TPA: protein kinase [Verrucomicrobiota bacterium]|nr:protein kinase [Verrucomicrobiota bacterium]